MFDYVDEALSCLTKERGRRGFYRLYGPGKRYVLERMMETEDDLATYLQG